MRNYPDSTNVITRLLKKQSQKCQRQTLNYYAVDFEDGRRNHEQRIQAASRSWKRQGNKVSSKAFRKKAVLLTL